MSSVSSLSRRSITTTVLFTSSSRTASWRWSSSTAPRSSKVVLVDSSRKADSEAVPETWLARVFKAAMLAPTCCSSDWAWFHRSEEHTSELQSLMRTSYAVFCLKKKKNKNVRDATQ